MRASIRFLRVPCEKYGILTAYSVRVSEKEVGFVWKKQTFSYRGKEGWNRGIRLHDYHPIRWEYGAEIGAYKAPRTYSRMMASDRLIESVILPAATATDAEVEHG